MSLQVYTTQIKETCHAALSFSGSLLYCKSGTYSVGTIPVEFKKNGRFVDGFYTTLKNIFNVITLRFCYTLVHEMGHAITVKTVSGKVDSVIICSNGTGDTLGDCDDRDEKFVLAAGPLAGALFACTQLFLSAAYFSSSPRIASFVYFSALSHMIRDFRYLILSVSKGKGDWGMLREKCLKSFFLTAFAMTVLYTLGLNLAYIAFSRSDFRGSIYSK
jgi:hypothetical protein